MPKSQSSMGGSWEGLRVFRTQCVQSLAEDMIQGDVYENVDLVGIFFDVISVCWLGSAQKVFLAVS